MTEYAGDELDWAKVDAVVRQAVPTVKGAPTVTQFTGGASNLTYEIAYDNAAYIFRCPPPGAQKGTAHNMLRESEIMAGISGAYPYVPGIIATSKTVDHLFDYDFMVMEKLDGLIPRRRMPKEVTLSEEQTRTLCTNFVDRLVDLHKIDVDQTTIGHLDRGDGYVQRQLQGWIKRYADAKTYNVPSFKRTVRWLEDNCPSDLPHCVIHNDWRLDNVVLDRNDPTAIIGVLDWELATIGDPMMDLGSALAYWVEPNDDRVMRFMQRQPSAEPGMMTRNEIVEYYGQQRNLDVTNWRFYEVFGLFRLAGIAQQIYYRYHHKKTRNPAFKQFWIAGNYFNWRCGRIIRQG